MLLVCSYVSLHIVLDCHHSNQGTMTLSQHSPISRIWNGVRPTWRKLFGIWSKVYYFILGAYSSPFIRLCARAHFINFRFFPSLFSSLSDSLEPLLEIARLPHAMGSGKMAKHFDVSINLWAWIRNELSFHFEPRHREMNRHFEIIK